MTPEGPGEGGGLDGVGLLYIALARLFDKPALAFATGAIYAAGAQVAWMVGRQAPPRLRRCRNAWEVSPQRP